MSESTAETIKRLTVHALLKDGLISDYDEAEEWCLRNGFIQRKKSVFETMFGKLCGKYPEAGENRIFWVRVTCHPPSPEENDGNVVPLKLVD